jgi:D-tyrosyl-tRNA(Tyr) deacylase
LIAYQCVVASEIEGFEMKLVIQRVLQAAVSIEGQEVAKIGPGLLVLLGIGSADTEALIPDAVRKLSELRIFSNSTGKFDESLLDGQRSILLVSQFTLYAATNKGRRPDFSQAMRPPVAEKLYSAFVKHCEEILPVPVRTGVFGAYMQVALVNDGPVTIILEVD